MVTSMPLDKFKTALLEERKRVMHALEYLHEENPGSLEDETGEFVPVSTDDHLGDLGTATFDRELDYTLEGNAEAVLKAIDRALQRIEAGTYGLCESCGRPISPERLEAIPWATRCIDCKRREERG
jgi:RNA polymerase-binding protein DksA